MATSGTTLDKRSSAQVKEPFYNRYPTQLGLFGLLLLIERGKLLDGWFLCIATSLMVLWHLYAIYHLGKQKMMNKQTAIEVVAALCCLATVYVCLFCQKQMIYQAFVGVDAVLCIGMTISFCVKYHKAGINSMLNADSECVFIDLLFASILLVYGLL